MPDAFDPFQTGIAAQGVSQLYLSGAGERSYFDVRSIYYYGFSEEDTQAQIPIIHPVLDYSNVLAQPVLGGEFSYKFNLTSLTRQQAEFDAVNQNAQASGACSSPTADTAVPANCLLRAIPGDYSRFSAEADWRRTLVTDSGQMITPFFQLRGDLASLEVDNQPGVSNFIAPGDSDLARAMPAVGAEYRYPFVDVEPWGTQTVEPIAQLILRPNEADIGKFPNEDSQSLVFDVLRTCSRSINTRAGIAWRAAAGSMSASNTRPRSTKQARSMLCSDSPISCSARTRSRFPILPIPDWKAASTNRFRITSVA